MAAQPVGAIEAGDLATVEMVGSTVMLQSKAGLSIKVSFLADNLLRIQAAGDGLFTSEGSGRAPIVLPFESGDVVVEARDHGGHRCFSTAEVDLVVHPAPLRLELRRSGEKGTLWRELKPLALGESDTTQTLDSDPSERIYGGGQQNGVFQFNGRLMEISYSGGWEEGDRPSPAPFYMSERGYGVLRNTWSDGIYDFRSDGYLTTTHAENRFDAYYMVGDSIHEVLDLYTRLTGRAGLIPRWAFGYGDADCYNDRDNVDKPGTTPTGWSDGPTGTTVDVVQTVASKYREHDMPGSWILPNDGYGCGYVDLPAVASRLRDLGFRTGLWTEDGVEKIAWEVGTAGTRVQKLDVAWTGKGSQWAFDANHEAARGFLDNSSSRPFIWTVMGWAGIQRYAVTWTGDQSGGWDLIRWHVPTLIGSGLSGMNYSTGDVDGIFGGSPETFTRDLQWKCFTPVLMGMSGWSRVERKHPWWFDEPYRSINRRYLKLRQRLMPYIYTLAHETATTGAPMVRGVVWDHPNDAHSADHPYQFFLGRDLLVAPVYRSQAASRGWRDDVYLPQGRWIDYFSGVVVDAGPEGRVLDIPVDLATLPVLVRAGAIIPMAPESLYDGQVAADPLTLDVYPHGESEFVLYEDDGSTRAYMEGEFATQRFAVIAPPAGERIVVTVEGARGSYRDMPGHRRLELEIHTRVAPRSVRLDGEALPSTTSRAVLDDAGHGWFFDAEDRYGLLHVKVGRIGIRSAHTIEVVVGPGVDTNASDGYPPRPPAQEIVFSDSLMVVARPAEEPGHPLESAFDGNPETWFRSVRDRSVAYGPHECTLSLGGRRLVEGFRISPRNDRHWKYGQVRDYEVFLTDVNGQWGEPVAVGVLERSREMQEVRFAARAGRLLRFRIVSTHDDGVDPMVLGAGVLTGRGYGAAKPVRVSPVTISELEILERRVPTAPRKVLELADGPEPIRMHGLSFDSGLTMRGERRLDLELEGDWQVFRAEVGIDEKSPGQGPVRFQVWGDGSLLFDSGRVGASTIVKPRIDIRGVTVLSLRTLAGEIEMVTHWAEAQLVGFEGDRMRRMEPPPGG